MFSECDNLIDISPLKNWDVSNGQYFRCMFSKCSNLTTVSGIINWNLSNAKQINAMFEKCEKMKDIDKLIDKFGNDIVSSNVGFLW